MPTTPFLDYAARHKLNDSPRTTCVACVVQDNIAYWAHAGDSRLYLMRDGRVIAQTRDHSRIRLLIDEGMISEAQAAVHPDRNKIYSCLGSPTPPEIEFSRKTPLSMATSCCCAPTACGASLPANRWR
jgi:serine/threonine protein phosphatase PrpC